MKNSQTSRDIGIFCSDIFDTMNELLKQVSRSFYLTIRVLPAPIRRQIGLAYLLARTTDTIADTRLVSVERRLSALHEMRSAVLEAAEGRAPKAPEFGEVAGARPVPAGQGSSAERSLLERTSAMLGMLASLSPDDRRLLRETIEIIIRGQEMDLIRFGSASADRPAALATDAELDQYTYCVAGCVGEFWTRMCRAHLFPQATVDDSFLLAKGIRFGKGLQLVNILRDIPGDLRLGRCYVPAARLEESGLTPSDLLDMGNMPRFRALYDGYLKEAEDDIRQGWAYTNAIPYSQVRVRLACAWPALIGMQTIVRLRLGNVLDSKERIKVSRSEVRLLVLRSFLRYPYPAGWSRLIDRVR